MSVDKVLRKGMAPTNWCPDHGSGIKPWAISTAPVIVEDQVVRVSEDLDIWDAWPLQEDDGTPVQIAPGGTLWMALGAPRFDDPNERHSHARIHLLHHREEGWRDLGAVMPDNFSPGSREWSGSAVLAPDGCTLTLYFTATGRRGETTPTFEQRLFSARATLTTNTKIPALLDWRDLSEIVQRDPEHYMASDAGTGKVGTIKAFRDPAYFRDPADNRRYLFFAGSSAKTDSAFNGVIGAIEAAPSGDAAWSIHPAIIDATHVNNELERPHVVLHKGLYYMFWSTQQHVFAPEYASAPTGLYGMVATSLAGEWRPLNGNGLVFANPDSAPRQAYSWLVLPDLSITSFIDDWGTGRSPEAPKRFGATFAPILHLQLSETRAVLVT